MKILLLACLTLALCNVSWADDGDDTVRQWVGKADAVFVGTLTEAPDGPAYREAGVANFGLKVRIDEVLKGDVGKGTVVVHLVRFESSDKDRLPFLAKGAQCIFFVAPMRSSEIRRWATVDPWFAVQPFNTHLTNRVKTLSEKKE